MNLHAPLLALTLLAAAMTAEAETRRGPAYTGALNTPAARIVGAWSNTSRVGPCNGSPGGPGQQTLLFHAGGTFLDNSRFPPGGIPNILGIAGNHQRSIGVGTWQYDPRSGEYTLEQRFDWFVDNSYHGYQVIERRILLSNDGQTASGPVIATRYAANGDMIVRLCGNALSERL